MPSPVRVRAGVEVIEAGPPGSLSSRPRSRFWAKVAPPEVTATTQVRPASSAPSAGAVWVAHEPGLPTRSGRLQRPDCVRRRMARVPVGRDRRQDRPAGARLGERRTGGGWRRCRPVRSRKPRPRVVPASTRPSRVVAATQGRLRWSRLSAGATMGEKAPRDPTTRASLAGVRHAQGAVVVAREQSTTRPARRGPRRRGGLSRAAARARRRRGGGSGSRRRGRCGSRSRRAGRGCTPRPSPCLCRSRSPRRRDPPDRRRTARRRRSRGLRRRGSPARARRRPSSPRRPSGPRRRRWRSPPSGCAPGGATPRSWCSCAGRSPMGRRWSR